MSTPPPPTITVLKAWLSYYIGQWNLAIEHLTALAASGYPVPPDIRTQVQRELNDLCNRWLQLTGNANHPPRTAIIQARQWATENQAAINLIDDYDRKGSHDTSTPEGDGAAGPVSGAGVL